MPQQGDLLQLIASFQCKELDFNDRNSVAKAALNQAGELEGGLAKCLLMVMAGWANEDTTRPQNADTNIVELHLMSELSQQDLLRKAKQANNMTWDELAVAIGISYRAIKTYILPATSKGNFRPMPNVVRVALVALVEKQSKIAA